MNQLEKTVDGYMEEYVGKTANGAAVVYIQNGTMVFSKGYGYADVENKVPVDPAETVFEYASISKTFTWTAVMQLAEQGEIDLNADICTYLPQEFAKELNQKKISEKPIRVVDLMNHRAGFGDQYFSMDFSSQDKLSESLEEALLKTMPDQIYESDGDGLLQLWSSSWRLPGGVCDRQKSGYISGGRSFCCDGNGRYDGRSKIR